MQRRAFLTESAATLLAACCPELCSANQGKTDTIPVTVNVDIRRRLGTIPRDFIGLGYEISSVSIPSLLSADDRTYVQLVRTLSDQGVIRIGGNTSDDASFKSDGRAISAARGTVVNSAALQELGSFLQATNWKLIWGLNLGSGDERQAVEEAEAVAAAVKSHLLAFEIGNEPDLFGRHAAHRREGYRYEDFLNEFRRYKAAIREKVPRCSFAGPDVAGATDWVAKFAKDEGSDLKLLTHHYYRECANATSTLTKLLQVDPKLAPELVTLRLASSTSNVPYRICETNSFCGGGRQSVSDSFGAALWVLDFMFQLASAGCAGVNIETGINQLGFVSWYSPIRQNERGASVAMPEYYGMLAFAQSCRGELVGVDCEAAGANISVYAAAGEDHSFSMTIINKEASRDARVSLSLPRTIGEGRVLRLSAPSLDAKDGVTFGGTVVSGDGIWAPGPTELLRSGAEDTSIQVPAGSAAVLKWAR